MRRRRRGLILLAAAAVLPALALPAVAAGPEPDAPAATPTLAQAFADASQRYDVPAQVLLAVSYAQTRWDDHGANPSTSGGYGPMHLTDLDLPRSAETADGSKTFTARAPGLHTLDTAARLTGRNPVDLRLDPAANIAGGAALLAEHQRSLGLPTGTGGDLGEWYGAVAKYSGAADTATAKSFADDVYAVLAEGAARTTNAGQQVSLPASPVTPDTAQLARAGLRTVAVGNDAVDCPKELACEWLPAPYQKYGPGAGDYGNHDKANRPRDMKIDYIIIHDTEVDWQGTLRLVQDPEYVSWQYTMRSADGKTWQHVKPNDIAWQAGNWYVNMHSIGIEHEGFAAQGATWYTETLYRNSARLVRYLAHRYDVPLDRAHIMGHDKIPGITPARIPQMHWDPGPYWDWEHYFDLLKAPFHKTPLPVKAGTIVTLIPGFDDNVQVVTGCETSGPCRSQGTNFVYLRTAPSDTAPLVKDIGLRPNGANSTTHVSDIGARVDAGSKFVVAERQGDWVAIWYLGNKGWFRSPAAAPDAYRTPGLVVKPKAGKTSVPVYGRAYPEQAAYPPEIPYAGNEVTPLPYTIGAGQAYPLADARIQTDFYHAKTFDTPPPNDHVQVVGNDRYYLIWFGHRMHYVRAADVDIRPTF